MASEEWKPVLGHESAYLISSYGKVWSVRNSKILKNKSHNDYFYVSLSVDGVRQERRLHRLVAEVFIPNPENKPTVNHINEIKTDNYVENLEWATVYEQNIHGTRIKRAVANTDWKARTAKMDYKAIAAKHDYHEMTRKQMKPVHQYNKQGIFIARYEGLALAARSTKVNQGHLCEHLKGDRKSCGGYIWKYEEATNTDVTV